MIFTNMYQLVLVTTLVLLSNTASGQRTLKLVLDEEFKVFNYQLWEHQITAGGGGNWEFEMYDNNRSTSYVRDGSLHINPVLMADDIGEQPNPNG